MMNASDVSGQLGWQCGNSRSQFNFALVHVILIISQSNISYFLFDGREPRAWSEYYLVYGLLL